MSKVDRSSNKSCKSKKTTMLDNWINGISRTIQRLLDGSLRQCQNDVLNSYVVEAKVKNLKSKLRFLKKTKKIIYERKIEKF